MSFWSELALAKWHGSAMILAVTKLKGHFDGQVLVPDEPVDLPINCELEIHVRPLQIGNSPLLKLAKALEAIPANPDWPEDGAAQHDHYLYGTPKRP